MKIYYVHKYLATITEFILVKKTTTTVTVKSDEASMITHTEKLETKFEKWFDTFDEAKQYLILFYNEEISFHLNVIKSNVGKLESIINLKQ